MIPRRLAVALLLALSAGLLFVPFPVTRADPSPPPADSPRPALLDPAAASGAWATQTIRSGKAFTRPGDRYLRIDDANRAHLAYGGNTLLYATEDSTGWRIETVDPAPAHDASLVLDNAGRPLIAYYDRANGDLRLARRAATGWQLETIDSNGDVGEFASLALDASGGLHIAYLDVTNAVIKYATSDGAGWRVSVIASARNDNWQRISLALAPSGTVHVAYINPQEQICHAAQEGAGWRVTEGIAGIYYADLSLAVDAAGLPHIAYGQSESGLYLAQPGPSGWSSAPIDRDRRITHVSLLADRAGNLHLAGSSSPKTIDPYADPPEPEAFAWYAWRNEGVWRFSAVDKRGESANLALHSDGTVRMAYFREDATLEVAVSGSLGGWASEVVDRESPIYGPVFLSLDATDAPHVTYSDVVVRHTWRTDTAWDVAALPVEQPATLEAFAVDSKGQPRLAIQEAYTRYDPPEWFHSIELKERSDEEWHSRGLESTWGTGPALAIDGQDRTHVAFAYNTRTYFPWDLPQHELRYYGPGLTEDVSAGAADSGVSIVADRAGRPHISSVFSQYHYQSLDYRTLQDGVWKSETILEGDPSIERASEIALDAEDRPAVLYWRDETMLLARRIEDVWRSETVLEGVGVTGDLAFDTAGRPHIVFRDEGGLSHLVLDSDGWRREAIPLASCLAGFAFVTTADDRLMVAYLEPLSNELRLATAPADGGASIYLPLIVR